MNARTQHPRTGAALAVGALALLVLACLLAATPAWAETEPTNYTIDEVSISAEVQTDASLHVVERRTVTFEEPVEDFHWEVYYPLDRYAELTLDSIRIAYLNDAGQLEEAVETVPEQPYVAKDSSSASKATNSQDTYYSYDRSKNQVHLYNPTGTEEGATLVIECDFTVANGVQAYKDVGELSWKYINENWKVPTENVTLSIMLPVPSDAEVKPGENVIAWGHGAESGVVDVSDEGGITYVVAHTNAQQYDEAHIIFPASWLTNLDRQKSSHYRSEMRSDAVIKAEMKWSDTSRIRAINSDILHSVVAIICLAAVVVSFAVCRRRGKPFEPAGIDGDPLDVSKLGLHPALLGCFARNGLVDDKDLVATLARLARRGAIGVAPGERGETEELAGGSDYLLSRNGSDADKAASENELDNQALELLFTVFGENDDKVWVGQIPAYARAHKKSFLGGMKAWKSLEKRTYLEAGLLDEKSVRARNRLLLVAGLFVVVAAVTWWLGEVTVAGLTVATGVAVGVFAFHTKRYTQRGVNLSEQVQRFRAELGALDEHTSFEGSAAYWFEVLEDAYVLGAGHETAKILRAHRPDLFEEADEARWGWFWPIRTQSPETKMASVTRRLEAAFARAFDATQQ